MDPDTIVAVSTAVGPSGLAVVRVSGPAAREVMAAVAPDVPPHAEPRRPHLSRIVDPRSNADVDRALVTLFAAPASYTGEDLVEISGHGGWLAPALVLEACVAAGARAAEPGEFTRRAYLNGKLDLVQAEAVLDLVSGRSRALHRAALHQLERGLSTRISDVRDALVGVEAYLAHHIDFPEEDDAPVPVERILEAADRVRSSLARLLDTAPEGELLREGALAVLAGRPNAGKSSLFNALLGEERAIVTELPGTTRDALEAVVSLGGYPFRLVDTAGLREGGERVERMGIEVARRYLGRADLVLLCVDAGAAPDEEERRFLDEMEGRPVVVLRTKSDVREGGSSVAAAGWRPEREIPVSVVTGEGLRRLVELLPSLAYGGLVRGGGDVPVITRARQRDAVRRALAEVEAFAAALAGGVPAEMAATHLRPAETALEELLGVITPDDVLDRLFREFCIGK